LFGPLSQPFPNRRVLGEDSSHVLGTHCTGNRTMQNPFVEAPADDLEDAQLVHRAVSGERDALESLVLRYQAWIFNIAVRMVFHPQNTEEVTQEVLIKAITGLGSFQGKSKFRTWLYRITANHVLNMSTYAVAINSISESDLPDPKSVPMDVPSLVGLDRKQRLIFVLGEILGVSDTVGSEIPETSADNFRNAWFVLVATSTSL